MADLAVTATLTAATTRYLPEALAWLLLAALITAPLYLAACWIWPFGTCHRCHGNGKRRAPVGRAFRLCPRCEGTGARLRVGRHVLNYLRSIHRASR